MWVELKAALVNKSLSDYRSQYIEVNEFISFFLKGNSITQSFYLSKKKSVISFFLFSNIIPKYIKKYDLIVLIQIRLTGWIEAVGSFLEKVNPLYKMVPDNNLHYQ